MRENPEYINNKKNLVRFTVSLQPVDSDSIQNFQILLHMWNILRSTSLEKRKFSKFRGFIVNRYSEQSPATVMTYIRPVRTPTTKYENLSEIFRKSLNLANKTNMKYAHIALDVGAAIKAHRVIWYCQKKWYYKFSQFRIFYYFKVTR